MNDAVNHQKKSKSWQLKAILLVTVLPIVAAYVAYYTGIGVPQERVNEGALVAPARNLKDLLPQAEGTTPTFENHSPWRLLIPVGRECNQACQDNLYLTRQVHVRLANKADRLERYAVNLGGAAGDQFLQGIAQQHPLLKRFSVDKEQWQKWVQGTNIPADFHSQPYYILVDQVGFAMMVYGVEHDGNQLLKDIKRVLRYSPE